ncbi:hypothetical protein B9Z65_8061 [Elsinoe australis]|uniref:Uncharacterized protein n=1 Tax=Elsinoe australis TaxID=40998 RepID=A0A2P7YVX3_9PEZI|nr:hypothetical protein B9Z65_8061 [Elsinoe australis]
MAGYVEVGTIEEFMLTGTKERVKVCRGDHAAALRDICHSLNEALRYADNDCHKLYLWQYIKSFESGDLNMYRESLKNWTKHKSPVIEDIFGFVEPYRDPYGIRAEFEGLVAIKDVEATRVVARLVETSDTFIRRLPWCGQDLNDNKGKGPFEKSLFEPPDFTCIQALAYCSTIIFPGINLPNYNDLRQDYGFKNVIITNRMLAESSEDLPCPAELVGAYLMDDKELLALFGYTDESEITAADVTYNLYMQQGTDGLRGLADFNKDSGKWGQAHARAHFAVMKFLLRQGNGCLTIDCDPAAGRLTVRIDRTKMYTDGKAALGQMLLKLHVYRCTADAKACREFYEDLSLADGEFLKWHEIVCATRQPKWVFCQPNTSLHGNDVVLKEYPPTTEGVIQSWAERELVVP